MVKLCQEKAGTWEKYMASIVILAIIVLAFCSVFGRGSPTNQVVITIPPGIEVKTSDLGLAFAVILFLIFRSLREQIVNSMRVFMKSVWSRFK
jgi:hypothetical protein